MTVPDLTVDAWRAEYRRIEQRLEAASDPAAREEVKREIIAFFKKVDAALTELGQVKQEIRTLVDRYKQAAAGAPAPEFLSARPAVQEALKAEAPSK